MEIKEEQKIKEIKTYLEELIPIIPITLEEYEADLVKKAACERYFQKIMSVSASLAFSILKIKDLPFPENDSGAYLILSENYIIDGDLAGRLSELESMKRLILDADEFIEDSEVYRMLKYELIENVNLFLDKLKEIN